MTYGKRTLIAVDQLLNTLLGGWPDETLSRPAAREQLRQKTEDFCRATYEAVYGVPLRYETREQ